MATLDDSVTKTRAMLGKLNELEMAAIDRGDLATVNALQSDINDLGLKLAQLRALQFQDTADRIAQLNNQLDRVTGSANDALADLSKLTSVLTGVLAVTKTLDGLIALAAKAGA